MFPDQRGARPLQVIRRVVVAQVAQAKGTVHQVRELISYLLRSLNVTAESPSLVRTDGAAPPSPTAVSRPDASGGGWKPTAESWSRTSSKQSLVTYSSTA